MTQLKVYAPNEAYAGTVGSVRFERGVATVDSDAKEMAYFRSAGYGIGKKLEPVPAPDKLEPTQHDGKTVDARDYAAPVPFGAPLRDAAVDPEPGDYLPPTNAGDANPHGPLVVAPGIHGVGPAPIRPGEVFVDDPDRQALEETALAQQVLVEGAPATSVGERFDAATNMGPLGLSDPGSVEMGVGATATTVSERPARSANKSAWVAYATAHGMTDVDAEAATKADLIARFDED